MSLRKNILIVGSGRSGTSMLAGTLAKAGYFMGDNLYAPRECNPKGFFEDELINSINERIIEATPTIKPFVFKRSCFRYHPQDGQRWLSLVRLSTTINSNSDIQAAIGDVTARTPFCFKDPRFSYTLPVWRPYLSDTVFICIFRNPADTVKSILKECQDSEVLQNLPITASIALKVWTLMYRHILSLHRHNGDWLFVHYDQMLSGSAFEKIQKLTGAEIDKGFPEASLKRSFSQAPMPREAMIVYQSLCSLADVKT